MSLNGPESNEPKVDVTEVDSNKVVQEIKNLADDVDGNPDSQKRLNEELTDAVIDWLNKLDSSAKETLKQSVLRFLENHGNQQWFENLNVWFVKLAESLWLQKNSEWVWGEKESVSWENAGAEVVDNKPKIELPNSPLKWNLEWIEEWEDGKKESKLYSNLVRNRPEEWQEDNSEQWLRLYEATAKLSDQLSKIDELLWNDKLKDNGDINWMKNFLENVKRAIDNTTENNVKLLQKYIYENLDGQDQTDFWSKSRRKNGEFDWKFWVGTLAGLNKVLENTWKYIDNVSNQLQQIESQENADTDQAKLDKVTSDPNAKATKGAEIKPEDLVLWEENWVEVSFVEGKEVKTDQVWTHNWEVKVKVWSKEKTLNITLNVEETEQAVDSTPLTLWGKQHLLMWNSADIATKAWLRGAMFYSWNFEQPQVEVWDDGKWVTKEAPANWVDYECYMRLTNRPWEIFKVKVDSQWNLCPIATQIDLQLSNKKGDFMSTEVLIENNNSCKAYLKNKLPDEIKYCDIWWNSGARDYMLKSYWRELTIEPMTMAGEWVCDKSDPRHLSRSLAFLNLTNYIRNVWDKYGNKDPNIKFDSDGSLWVKWLKTPSISRWKMRVNWFPIEYGLSWVSNESLSNFKKYNNHEDWRDDWDRKKANKIYKKL